jgi:hypothetical protein
MIAPHRNNGRNPRRRTGAQARALLEAPEDRAALRPALRLPSLGGPPRAARGGPPQLGEAGVHRHPAEVLVRWVLATPHPWLRSGGESDGNATSKVLQQTDAPASDTC